MKNDKKRLIKFLKKTTPRLITSHAFAELLRDAGFEIEYIGEGCFRTGYRLMGTDWMLKIPTSASSRAHARREVAVIRKLQKKKATRYLIPELHYFNHKSGVSVMTYYENGADAKYDPHASYAGFFWETLHTVSNLIKAATGVGVGDLGGNNIVFPEDGSMKILDLGLA